MRTAVQVVWVLVAFAAFVLALVGLRSLGVAQYGGYAVFGCFILAWVTWRTYLKKP